MGHDTVTDTDLEALFERIDACHREDPNGLALDHARTVYDWVMRLRPAASPELRVAARAQHIRRWQVPRDTYPRNRGGYLRWRRDLQKFHARETAAILEACGFGGAFVARVGALLQKQDLARDPETRTLEDGLCVAFMERQLAGFSSRQPAATMQRILRRTWDKMSPAGREAALALPLPEEVRALLVRSLEQAD